MSSLLLLLRKFYITMRCDLGFSTLLCSQHIVLYLLVEVSVSAMKQTTNNLQTWQYCGLQHCDDFWSENVLCVMVRIENCGLFFISSYDA